MNNEELTDELVTILGYMRGSMSATDAARVGGLISGICIAQASEPHTPERKQLCDEIDELATDALLTSDGLGRFDIFGPN